MHAMAASDARHAAVFTRAGAIPWLVGLTRHWPYHLCGRNAALALRELLQNQDYLASTSVSVTHVDCMFLPALGH